MEITGALQIVLMAGWPVAQVQMPGLFNARAQVPGAQTVLVPIAMPPEGLAPLVRGLEKAANCLGVVLTAPHKQAAARLADLRRPRVDVLGVANVLRRTSRGWEAEMFDGEGFWNGAAEEGFDPRGRRLALLGAGAAARAIAHEFFGRGGRTIVFRTADADEARAMQHLDPRSLPWTNETRMDDIDILVNATPVGMQHLPGLPVEAETLHALPAHALVADLVTQPERTGLICEASKRGLKTMLGEVTARGQLEPVANFLGVQFAGGTP